MCKCVIRTNKIVVLFSDYYQITHNQLTVTHDYFHSKPNYGK